MSEAKKPASRSRATSPKVKGDSSVSKKSPATKVIVKRVRQKTAATVSLSESKKLVKKVPRKAAPPRIDLEDAPIKSPFSFLARKKESDKTTTKKVPIKESSEEVVIPTNMSLRAMSKARAIAELLDGDFKYSFYRIAYVASFCFIAIGVALGFPRVFIESTTPVATQQSAQVLMPFIASTTIGILSGPVSFEMLSTLPSRIDDEDKVTFLANNASDVYTYVQQDMVGGMVFGVQTDVSVTNSLLDGKYRTTVYANKLPDGKYVLWAVGKSLDDVPSAPFRLGRFQKGHDVVVVIDDEEEPVIDVPVVEDPDDVEDEVEDVELIDTHTDSGFYLIVDNRTLVGDVVININAPQSASGINLYARPNASINPIYIGAASTMYGRWRVAFKSPAVLPNGDYQLYATMKTPNGESRTPGIGVKVSNLTTTPYVPPVTVPKPAPINTPGTEPTTQPTPTTPIGVSETPGREFYTYPTSGSLSPTVENSLLAPESNPNNIDDVVIDQSDRLIRQDLGDVNDLLKRYAVAQQAGDDTLIDNARQALDEKRESLVNEALKSSQTRDVADDIDRQLSAQFEELKSRIESFETLRKERTQDESAQDTDNDGVSNFDEVNIYGTNPNSADTDSDGFNDGIEIIRGYNPLSAESESIITYEFPKDIIAPIREDILTVEAVTPIIELDDSIGLPPVQAEIRGKALPNSFVTLYIYSTPTIVTVKTDADGSFVYTFEKELEDGEHQVYVAVTDNTGTILAQSNPFTFIKQAQAFTPVDASEEEIVTSETITEVVADSSYNMVAGMGILALGVILLMLGISIRTSEPKVVVTEIKRDEKKKT